MAVTNFIPQIWSARLQANLDKKLVFANAVNRDYEGEIKNVGDRVKINKIGDITIFDYKTGKASAGAKRLGEPEELSGTQQELIIDQAKSFNFAVDDIDAVQANVNLIEKAMEKASYNMADVIDQYIATFTKDASIKVGATASTEVTKDNAYDLLIDLSVSLDENNVTRAGRFVVLPAWYLGLLSKDARFTKDFKVLENGVVDGANVAGFKIMQSNNVIKSGSDYTIMAGTQQAISYAGQLTKIEHYRPQNTFADAVKGLYVYGAKVIEPKALASMKCKIKTT